ncbi:DUF599 domain-containing protein [Methylobacterium sp. P31]
MGSFSYSDILAILVFLLAWGAYSASLERVENGRVSLNRMMNSHRHLWSNQLGVRENRVVDILINATLQNGTAFFASTSLVALGGVLSFSNTTDDMLTMLSGLLFNQPFDREVWITKLLGIAIIFIYAFFKFSWSFRLFYYVSILMGAVPDRTGDFEDVKRASNRVAIANIEAGRHFNRGLQAFFFALAYLGWFVGPYVLMTTTAAVLFVMWRRQFGPDARQALTDV